jgi:hypothetical protein
MAKIKLIVNGREVSPSDFGNALQAAIIQKAGEAIQKKLKDIRCQTHGQAPEVVIDATNSKQLKFEIFGCCEGIKEQVSQLLK